MLSGENKIIEEIPQEVTDNHILESKGDLLKVPEELGAKLWLDMLIKQMFMIMMFVRAEREADWPLRPEAFQQMIPYVLAAGHVNYAQYGTCHEEPHSRDCYSFHE